MPKLGPDSKEYSFSLNCISRIKTSSQVGMKLLLKILANLARISCGLLRNSGQLVRNFCAGPKWNVSQLGTYSYVFSLRQANPFLKNACPWFLLGPFSWPPVFLCCFAPRCRSGLCPRPCLSARLPAVSWAVERYSVVKVPDPVKNLTRL